MISYEEVRANFSYNKKTGFFTWRVQKRSRGGLTKIGQRVGCLTSNGYLRTTLYGKCYSVHRLIWLYVTGSWTKQDIDHKNGIKDDNRWLNLREAPRSINQENFRKAFVTNKSKLIGAWRSSNGRRWRSIIQVKRKRIFLGYFDSAMEAHLAYIAAKRRLHEGCTI